MKILILQTWIFLFMTGRYAADGKDLVTKNYQSCSTVTPVLYVDEDQKVGTALFSFNLTAGEGFSITNDPGGYLSFTNSSGYGIVSLKKAFDYEHIDSYTYDLTCNGIRYENRIKIQNVIEGQLKFDQSQYTASVKEDAAIGYVVIPKINIRIGDERTDTYYLTTEIKSNTFSLVYIGPSVYNLVLATNLSYADHQKYTFTATAHLDGHPEMNDINDTATFTISVIDIDNLNPKFEQKSYSIALPENSNTSQFTNPHLKAVDGDKGIDAKINYEIIQVLPDKGWLSIDQETGQIKVKVKPDREECNQLTMIVKGYQVDNKDFRFDVTSVNVTITDVDDNHPKMEESKYDVSIPENSPNNTMVLQVHASDLDQGDNAKFVFSFDTGKDVCHGLLLNEVSGVISVTDSRELDREAFPTFVCYVHAKGSGGKHLSSNTSTITVTLIDENDNNPVFNLTTYSYNITKNFTVGSMIGKVTANDKDQSSDITYKMKDTSFKTFLVNSKTGAITLALSLKENFSRSYTFEVEASDGDKKAPRFSSTIVRIDVSDVNIHTPKFELQQYNISLLEDVRTGTDVILLKAEDQDPDDHLVYSVVGDSAKYFSINITSGMLSLYRKLDYETDYNPLNINVPVSDSVHSSTALVVVNIIDINDNPPTFNKTSYLFNMDEEKRGTIGHVFATDADSGNNKKFTYSIEAPWAENFSISETGDITTKVKLDRESIDNVQGQVKVVVLATDQGKPPLTGTTEVTVTVKDINDNCPYFNTQDQIFTYVFNELETPHNFHQIQAQDMDMDPANRKMSYSLSGQHHEVFSATNGNLSATQQLKMENSVNGQITLTIVVSNNPDCTTRQTATQTVIIDIKDVNRFLPVFKLTSYSFTLAENFSVGSKLHGPSIQAIDKDTSAKYNTVTYWIASGNDDGHFYMDQKTADIYLVKPLDFEQKTRYTLSVHATDGHPLYNGSLVNSSVTVTIHVQDVNDNPPKFKKDYYTCNFLENQKTSENNCTIVAEDKDKGTRLSYQLNDTSTFTLPNVGGGVTVKTGVSLDYDQGPQEYTLQVTATDNGSPKLTGTAIIKINVINLNDNPPEFPNNYTFTAMEDAAINTIIGAVQAVDKDGDDITYSLATSTTGIILASDTGLLSLNSTLLDKEKLTVIVHASDKTNTGTATVTVNIQDTNNHAPIFSPNTYNVTVTENVESAVVVNVQATDKDRSPENKKISYSIETPWRENFTINSASGELKVKGDLDREMLDDKGVISVIVMATDDGKPRLTGTAVVSIRVKDVNDNCPYYGTDKEVTYVFKEYANPKKFHYFMAKDNDKERNNSYFSNYHWLPSSFEKIGFQFKGDGFVSALAPLLLDRTGSKTNLVNILQFNASQDCPVTSTATQTITVIVQDVNDHTPKFSHITYSCTLNEDFMEGNKIDMLSISATDDDPTVQFNTVHYNISSGNNGNHFYIDEFSGSLILVKKLDFEKVSSYQLQITATDGEPFNATRVIQTSTATVNINVLDANDNAPKFDQMLYKCTVEESKKGIIPSCQLNVTDLDTGKNGQVTVSVLNDTHFGMNNRPNGLWNVGVLNTLDYDKGQRLWHLDIIAKDSGTPPKQSSAIVEVTITNINDNRPNFIAPPYNFSMPEDTEIGSLVGTILADDIDGDNLTYSVSNSEFRIDRTTGHLYTSASFLNKLAPITFDVQVSDNLHNQTATVTVHVTDVNNNPPKFEPPSYSFQVDENESGKNLGKLNATDKDLKDNGKFTYQLLASEWKNNFTVNSLTGQISLLGAIDRELIDRTDGEINLVVLATDKGTPSLTGTTEVIVKVNDVNDNCPEFNTEDKKFVYIFHELTDQPNFHTAVAYDKDSTSQYNQITYNLTKGSAYFTISNHGDLSTKQKLTMEHTMDGKFDIVIGAYNTDLHPCGGSVAFQDVTVVLKDVNNHAPIMKKKNFTFSLPENFMVGSSINPTDRIIAEDKDTSKEYSTVTYWIQGGHTSFHVDHYTGDLYLVKHLDYDEGPKTYTIKVTAIDCLNSTDGHCNHNDTATVRIDVTDVNDNPPVFTQELYHCTVKENFTGQIEHCLVKANDKDSGLNGNFTYKTLNSSYTVRAAGQISLNTVLDYESGIHEYTVLVQAIDHGNKSLTGSATVIVKLEDINDNPPIFIGTPYHFQLPENEPLGSIIGLLSTMDADNNSALTLSLRGPTGEFTIDNSGMLKSNKSFDYEMDPKRYTIDVRVYDGVFTTNTSVVIDIINVNDNQPVFTNNTYHINIKEDVSAKTYGIFHASDVDNLGKLSYSVVGQDDYCSDIFTMDTSGNLYINNTNHCLDYDVSSVHTLLIQAKDGKPFNHESRSVIEVTIENVDNKPPKFSQPVYKGSVKENQYVSTVILEVEAADNDTPQNKLKYTVLTFTDNFKFIGNSLVTVKPLDAEVMTTYTVNISVSDGVRVDNAMVEITVQDVNDHPPVFIKDPWTFSIPANAEGNRLVGRVSAKDPDVSNESVTYYLTKGDHFYIDNTTGVLYVMDGKGHNQFTANKTYTVTVSAIDHGQPPLTNSATINIFIDMTNHYPPKFETIPSQILIPENATIGTAIVTVTANDTDPGNAGKIFYKLAPDSSMNGMFEIDALTGKISLNGSLDFEKVGNYELTVLAIDKADDPKTGTTHVQIRVEDVNEKPHFLEKIDGLCISSPILIDQLVAVVNAEDPDKSDKLTYSIEQPSDFKIDLVSGEIRAKANLSKTNFNITVNVKDKGGLTDRKEIDLYNNPSLVITPAIVTVSVRENSTDHNITQIKAISSEKLFYSLFNTEGFSVDSSGLITSNKALDREKAAQHVIHVMVNSTKSSCKAQVNVKVLDVNDNPPRFAFLYDTSTIPEDHSVGSCFFPLPVEDPDLNTHLNLTIIEDNSGGKFAIQSFGNQTGGCLELKSPVDFDEMPENLHGIYKLKAEVNDGKFSSTREIKIKIEDVNDNTPVFNSTHYNASVSENMPVHTSIIHLTAYDKDAIDQGLITYSLSGSDSKYFRIRNTSYFGDLETDTSLDRENRSSYTVIVQAHDTAGHTGNTTVSITVLDVNDNPPTFINKPYNFNHKEGITSVRFQMPVETVDPDLGKNGTVVFTLLDGNEKGLFNITTLKNKTGIITVMKALDRESPHVQKENGTAVYTLHIQAMDEGNPQQSAMAVVTLKVEDINDCVPQFGKSHYNATVLEGSPKGFSILTVTAADCDYNPEFRDIKYSLNGTDSDLFEIDKYGEITLNTTIEVRQHKEKFELTIVANDSLNINKVGLTVEISDVNDHDPQFTQDVYNFTTPETDGVTAPDIIIGTVSATDQDQGENGMVEYSIISMDVENLFNISEKGEIIVIGALDRDTCISSRYPFTVIARDRGASRRTGYTEVIVYVTDINDNSPIFTETEYSGIVPENSNDGTVVNIVPPIQALDIDQGINGTAGIRYSILHSNQMFEIDEKTGEVTVNSSDLDRESVANYTIEVEASDRLGKGNKQTVNLTIILSDFNDVPPQFTSDNYVFYINESALSGQGIGAVEATDQDVVGKVKYRILSGSDGKFYVDSLSGNISTTGGLDRETKSDFTIIMDAFDGRQESNTTVHIHVQDANDNCPVFHPQTLKAWVPENTNNSSVVYRVTATDADIGENAIITLYTNISENSLFSAENDSIVLNGELDREKQDLYQFHVFAKDHGNPPCTVSTTMDIYVQDVNDNPPVFYDAEDKRIDQASASILEKSPVGSPIFLPDVRDEDIGENGKVEFNLEATKPDILRYFTINKKTGVVAIHQQIDLNYLNRLLIFDKNATKNAILEMTVVASDKGNPPMSSNLILKVVVEGINDQAPVFLLPNYHFVIDENLVTDSFVGQVEAVVENGTNSKLQYSLIPNSVSSSYFSVTINSGNITTSTKIDREKTPGFTFAVQVKDGKIPERTAYTIVNVAITDMNDNSPQFQQKSYDYIIEENTYPTPISVMAADPDDGLNGKIVYTLLDNHYERFILNETTGLLSVNGTLDREDISTYNLTVQAQDKGSPPLESLVSVLVVVTDQNDNTPRFTLPHVTCNITENNQPGEPLCSVKAVDMDSGLNGSVVYMFHGHNYPQFEIDPRVGSISTLMSLDFEEQSVYNLTIMAMDLGNPSLNSTMVVTVDVLDMYDTAPHFTQRVYERTVNIKTPLSATILSVNAGKYHYSYDIKDGNQGGHFRISQSSGEITLVSNFGSSVLEYQLNISATDGHSTVYTKVLIHVASNNIEKQNNTYITGIPENISNRTLLIDLNYTDGSNVEFHYKLSQIIPDVKNTFELDETTGALYCIKELDRETIDQYKFYIRAVPVSNRKKRSVDPSTELIVVVNVEDVNDNPPAFTGGQQIMTIGIPDTTNTGDLVTTLQAVDPDSTSIVTYSFTGGYDKDSFSVDSTTGKVYSQIKVNSQKVYNVTAQATDGTLSTQVNIVFLVTSNVDKLILTIPITTSEFETKQSVILRNISTIVGFNIEMEKKDVHVDNKKHTVDLSRTDIYFHGINRTGGFIVPRQTAFRIIHEKSKEIAELFAVHDISVITYHTTISPHKMSESEIALLTIGIIILLSCLLALIAAKYNWNQFERSKNVVRDKLWELNSLHSSHTNGTVAMRQTDDGFVNPAFKETQFVSNEQNLGASNVDENLTLQRRKEYESQEVILELPYEPIEANIPQPGIREMSLGYDSGLENESNSTDENAEEPRQDNGEIRIETTVQRDEHEGHDEAGPSYSQEVFTFDMETGDTDDNEMDDDVGDKGLKRRKSSKKKTNKDLKIFSISPGDSDDDVDLNKSQRYGAKSKKTVSNTLTTGRIEDDPGEVTQPTVDQKIQDISKGTVNKLENNDKKSEVNVKIKGDNSTESDSEEDIEITSF